MNNPLELLLRRQKAAQGGRIRFGGGGTMGSEDRGYQGGGQGGMGNTGGNNKGGNKGGNKVDFNANRETTDAALERLEKTGSSALADNTTGNDQTTTTDYDPSIHTNSIIEAMFNPDLTFKYNPQMDYVNRVYGGLRPDQQQRILNQVDPTNKLFGGDFGAFVDANYGNLYDAGNITGQNIADAFTSVGDYFTGIPDRIANYDPTMPTQDGITNLAQNIGKTIFANPFTTMMGMNPAGLPLGMFAALTMNKGPYTKESIESGEFANLANAPADYKQAVQQAMGGTFSPEQMAQIASGMAAKAEEQANTKTGVELTAEEKAELQAQMNAASIQSYKDTLDQQQLRIYERLAGQGYNDDYIRAYLGLL